MNNNSVILEKVALEIQEKLVAAGVAESELPAIMESLLAKTIGDIVDELNETLDEEQKTKLDALSETPAPEEVLAILGVSDEQFGKEYLIRLNLYLENLEENMDSLQEELKTSQG